MKPERRLDEPWNLPPAPTWCGNVLMDWAKQSPAQRKAEWERMPTWWHEKWGHERIEYWRTRL
jgi:hypothetical protein